MLRVAKSFGVVCIVLACVIFVQRAAAQEETILRGSYGKGRLNAAMTGTNLVLTWPAQAGTWKLLAQEPAYTGEWKPVTSDYRTNNETVSVTMPMPQQTTLYRVVRTITRRNTTIPAMPPMPVPSTNRPPRLPQPH